MTNHLRKLSFFVLIAIFSCTQQSAKREINAYFDIDSLFMEQTYLLAGVPFSKSAVIDGKSETGHVTFDTTAWQKELAMYIGLDINKAALVGAYESSEEVTPAGKSVSYQLKQANDAGVQWIQLNQNKDGLVTGLEALFREENALYQNQRKLSATFNIENGKSVLQTYRIEGYQKILLKDTVNYTIVASRVR